MPGTSDAEAFAALARRLKEAGERGLRDELYSRINDSAGPVARQIEDVGHLADYMPNRYAPVLAGDLTAGVSKLTGRNPGVVIRARSRQRRRKLRQLDAGIIQHPLFGNPEHWYTQTSGMRAGFFTDPAQHSAPQVREAILSAMAETARKIMKG